MKFTKLHGCGNGYIYVNLFEETLENPAEIPLEIILDEVLRPMCIILVPVSAC